jgi:hypothetical protein
MKRREDFLHVVVYRNNFSSTQICENVDWQWDFKKGEALINNIWVLNPDKNYVSCTEQEFRENMFDAIFDLDIFEYAISKKS